MSIELHIANPDVTDGNLQISWCVSPDVLASLNERKIKNPVLLIVSYPDGERYSPNKEHRQLVLLKDLITYIQIAHSGSNKIVGLLTDDDGLKAAKKWWLKRDYSGWYRTPVLNVDGSNYNEDTIIRHGAEFFAPMLSVDVPAGAFAKEPAQWEKNWVNHFFKTNPIDQCAFRRRRFFAFGIQPFIIALMTILRLVPTLWSLLIGSRTFSLNYLLHPIRYQMVDASELFGKGNIFFPKEENQTGTWRDFVLLPLMPVIFIPLALIIFAITYCNMWIMMMITIVIVAIFAFLGPKVFGYINTLLKARMDRFQAWYLDKNELPLITCSPGKKLNWDNLPSKHKTIRLRFQEIKSRVCRPFSR